MCSLTGSRYPGDEYALWGSGSFAGIWILLLFDDSGPMAWLIGQVVAAGTLTIAVAGLILDLVRAPRRLLLIVWLVLAGGLALSTLAQHPSLQRAFAKHGSWQAYTLFGLTAGLSASTALFLLLTPLWWQFCPGFRRADLNAILTCAVALNVF